jgi:selenocysteine-specific elongation factor
VPSRSYIVATAGHVDHGKSALVKALTGTDPDRLPEEKARGITIDLGFAHLKLADASGELHVGIVDVPGHEDFVKNMVSGVGAIDAALLVVAADDGWMPQTEEHLQILAYLGIGNAVVALTKIDLPGVQQQDVIARIHGELANSPFAHAPIIATSTVTGAGLDDLKSALRELLARTPPPRDIGKPRLSIDRIFTLHGIGTVVTGSLNGGPLKRGQAVVVEPEGHASRIRSIQSFSRDVEVSYPGMRTAINLPLGQGGDSGLRRGQVVTLPEFRHATKSIDVLLQRSERLLNRTDPTARPLKTGAIIRVHHGTANVAARIQLLDSPTIGPGESCLARLALEQSFCVVSGDRFVARDWSEQNTLAGGIVLDVDTASVALKRPDHRELLEQRAKARADVETFTRTQVVRDRAVRRSELLVKSQFSAVEVESAITRLAGSGEIKAAGDWVVAGHWWQDLQDRAAAMIAHEHSAHPERGGLALQALRQQLDLAAELLDVFVVDLCQRGYVQVGAVIRSAKHQPALPAHLQAAGQKLRATLSAKPLEPPSRKDLTPDDLSRQALRFLLETGEATELSAEVVLVSEHFRAAAQAVKCFLEEKGGATVSDLRQALGTSRRVVVPLLERLDKDGITLRQGDRRVLRPRP